MVLKTNSLRYGILTVDLCWIVCAMALSYVLRYEWSWQDAARIPLAAFVPFLAFALLFWGVLFVGSRLDGFRGGWRITGILSELSPAVLSLMILLFAGAYLGRLYLSRLILGYFGVLFFIGLVAIRLVARAAIASCYRSGAVRKAVIVGTGQIASEIARKIESHPEMLWKVAGFLCPAENTPNTTFLDIKPAPIQVRSVGIADLLRSRDIDDLIVALPKPGHPEIADMVNRCWNQGIAVSFVPQPYELYRSQPALIDLDGLPLVKLGGVRSVQVDPFWKRLLDLFVSACALLVVGPAILTVAASLKIRRGKGFCSETRCGQFGQTFQMYRLNSGRHAQKLPFYEFLMQQSSFTELPQLVNVLRGEMSLVGPRPEEPDKVRHYSEWQRQRLSVKPGITGLAQVHGLRDQNSSEDKTRYDLQYILHRSLFLDISLLLQTLSTLALRPFPKKRQAHSSRVHADALVAAALEESLSRAHRS